MASLLGSMINKINEKAQFSDKDTYLPFEV